MSYQQQKGTKYEHTLGNTVYEATSGDLIPLAAGYTSRHGDSADLLIDDGEAVHVFECKRTSQDAYSFEYSEDGNDDVWGLGRFCTDYPRPTYPYLAVRFDNRKLAIAKLFIEKFDETAEYLQSSVKTSPIEASVTHANNVRFYKPDSGDWTASNLENEDAQAVLDAIGYRL
jgi:Holliday junction resolvase